MELENSEIVQSPSKLSTPKTSLPSPTSSKLLTPPSSADSNGKGTTKKRANFTEEQKQMLREALQENHYPDAETRQDLATKLNLTMHQIKVSTFSQCGNIRIFPSFHISREINFGASRSPKNAF